MTQTYTNHQTNQPTNQPTNHTCIHMYIETHMHRSTVNIHSERSWFSSLLKRKLTLQQQCWKISGQNSKCFK